MGHDELAVIEHVVTDQTVDEVGDLWQQLGWFAFELRERLGQPVGDAHVLAAQLPHQLDVVIARHRQGGALRRHRHDQPQHLGHLGAAVDQIADEDRLAPLWVRRREAVLGVVCFQARDPVSELLQQGFELVEAAMDVPDDVERPVLGSAVVPQRLALDRGRLDVLD